MKGSMEVQTLVYLALGVLLFAALAYILLTYTPLGSKTIFSMIDDWTNSMSPEEKNLVKAMSCAYYRCIDGCGSGKVKQANWEDENGEKVSCLDNFCKDEWRDDEGKICGDTAKENPVKVYLDSDITVSKDHWKIFFKEEFGYHPFLTRMNCEPFGSVLLQGTQGIIFPEKTECEDDDGGGISFSSAYMAKSCTLYVGSYDIWSGKAGGNDAEDIIICSDE
jgi:hypothetical protein